MATPPAVSPTYQTVTTTTPTVSTVALVTPPAIPNVPPPKKSSSAVSPPRPSTPQEKSTPRVSTSPPHKSSSGLSPPPPRRGGGEKGVSTSHSSPLPSDSSSSSTTLIPVFVATAIVGIVLLLVFSIICLCCYNKKRRRRNYEPSNDYGYPPVLKSKVPDDSCSGQLQNLHHSPPASENRVVKFPPPPQHVASRRPLSSESIPLSKQCVSPPPPPSINSSGDSVSNYSGSEHHLPPILPPSPGIVLGFGHSNFTYDELEIATNGFSDDNLLGQGGFGYVHKGTLPNGKQVAVKQLKHGGGQGEREFHAEVEIIGRVHHKHLVSLVGYCVTGGQRMLVYDFVPNNTLEFHLHGKDQPIMEWPLRNKIALGAAKGLAYLHEDCYPKIIHRDIKASNILIDFKFEAKVSDFGLAKFSSDSNTHVSTRVMGTFGYLAPEYASTGKLTEKSDVFSFGVVILELITGHKPINTSNSYAEDSLVDWARPLLTLSLQNNNFNDLVDPRLGKNYDTYEMIRMVSCAAACIRRTARHRPRMSQVVRALEGDVSLDVLNEDAMKDGHSNSPHERSDYDSGKYYDHMKKFRRALMSGEVGSGEYSKTSEYGLYASASSIEDQKTDEFFEKRNKMQNMKSNS